MPIYSKKEFASLCKQKTNYLAVQIKRGKVVTNPNGNIDTSDPINTLYLEKMIGRVELGQEALKVAVPIARNPRPGSPKPQKTLIYIPDIDEDDEITEDDTEQDAPPSIVKMLGDERLKNIPYPELEKIYKYQQGEHLKKKIEREEIEIAKKKGEVIPTELLPPVIVQHNQCFLSEFRNATEKILTDYTQIKDFTVEEIADMRARMIKAINRAAEEATQNSLQAIEVIVKNYTEKRASGQKA